MQKYYIHQRVRIMSPEEKFVEGWAGLMELHANETHKVEAIHLTDDGIYYRLSGTFQMWKEDCLDKD